MANAKMHRPKIGDVIEFIVQDYPMYGQFTHKHIRPPRYGHFLRLFSGRHAVRPKNLEDCIAGVPVFSCFFPLSVAINCGMVSAMGNTPIAPPLRQFPVFRCGVNDPKTNKVEIWWLWDGEREWRVGELTAEQEQFPVRGIWNDTLLIERLPSGWTPNRDSLS
ncbi:MAG: hypothetical protein ABI306_04985 [Caulobacteraceae bacterium]